MATAKRGTQTSRLAKVTHAQQLLDTPDGIYSCKGAYMYVFFFSFFPSGLWASPHISFISSEWTGCPLPIHGELVTGLRHPGLNKLQEKYRAEEKSGHQQKKKKL